MKNLSVLPVLMLLILFSSCKETSPIVGQWKLEKMELNDGSEIFSNVLGNPMYTFNDDNTYQHAVSGQIEKGTYKITEDKLVITFKDLDKTTEMKIIELTDKKLIWKIGEESVSTVYLKR